MSRQNDDAARKAVQQGATTAREVADQTGLSDHQARQALVHLETTGEVEADGSTDDLQNKFKPTGS